MKSKLAAIGLPLLVLTIAGGVTDRAVRDVWREVRAKEPELNLREFESALGQGLTMGLLGGFRAVIADFLWLRMNLAWEQRNLPATQTLITLVQSVDPRPLYFWINGARIVAYDLPVWRIDAAGGGRSVPAAVQQEFYQEQAELGLRLLDRAMAYHPDEPLLWLEMAKIRQWKLDDIAGAADLYRRAAETGRAPYYAARIYAELLKRVGRYQEAYNWLVKLHPALPPDDPYAMADIVLGRIRELETILDVPTVDRYQPAMEDDVF